MTKTQLMVLMTAVVMFSLTVHEYSHGRVALMLGDNTAQRLGRLSFNPLRIWILWVFYFSILSDLAGPNQFLWIGETLRIRAEI